MYVLERFFSDGSHGEIFGPFEGETAAMAFARQSFRGIEVFTPDREKLGRSTHGARLLLVRLTTPRGVTNAVYVA